MCYFNLHPTSPSGPFCHQGSLHHWLLQQAQNKSLLQGRWDSSAAGKTLWTGKKVWPRSPATLSPTLSPSHHPAWHWKWVKNFLSYFKMNIKTLFQNHTVFKELLLCNIPPSIPKWQWLPEERCLLWPVSPSSKTSPIWGWKYRTHWVSSWLAGASQEQSL